MSADPLAGSIGDPQSLNRFAYVLNNPGNATDPLGLHERPTYDNPPPGCVFSCSGTGIAVGGNDIFDAISGAPGTYWYTDMYGNTSFGFDFSLYFGETRYRDFAGLTGTIGAAGWNTYIRDSGTEILASGLYLELHAFWEAEGALKDELIRAELEAYNKALAQGLPEQTAIELAKTAAEEAVPQLKDYSDFLGEWGARIENKIECTFLYQVPGFCDD